MAVEQALVMPKVGESVTEGTVLKWLKADGDHVAVDEAVLEVETEKVNVEVPSQWSGVLRIVVPEGETVAVGEPFGFVLTEEAAPVAAAQPAPARPTRQSSVARAPAQPARTAAPAGDEGPAARYSPAVLTLAREHNIDLTRLTGSGLDGRITRKDVLAFLATGAPDTAAATAGAPAAPSPGAPGAGRVIPLTPTRRTIAARMVQSASTIPHVWLMVEANVSDLVRWRAEVKDEFRRREGFDLTYLPFAIKAAVEGLKEHPILNSAWSDAGIELKPEINIGVAVATDEGLIVPVIHRADGLSIAAVAGRLADLAERARSRKLRIEDVQGGTFTVDNTGAFGSIISKPIINFPQAAIMTMEAIVQRAVVVNEAIAIRHMVNICLSFDHRILDGSQAGAFLATVRHRLQTFGPETLLY